jgi:hypothetical protein
MNEKEHYTTGEIEHNIVGEYFKGVNEELNLPPGAFVEVKDFLNSDTRLSLFMYKETVQAFVIETRNDFNNIIVIKGKCYERTDSH